MGHTDAFFTFLVVTVENSKMLWCLQREQLEWRSRKLQKLFFSFLSRMTLKAVLGVLAGYAPARASRALNFRREAAEAAPLSRKEPLSHSRGNNPLCPNIKSAF